MTIPGFRLAVLAVVCSPLIMYMRDTFPPDNGDPRASLADNLVIHKRGRFATEPTPAPEHLYREKAASRDKLAEDVMSRRPGMRHDLCDHRQRKDFADRAEKYAREKLRAVQEIGQRHGLESARRMEATWMTPISRNAEAFIAKAMADGHIALDDFDLMPRVEAKRYAVRVQVRPVSC